MNDIIKEDLLSILSNAIEIIKKGDVLGLKELSNHTIHNASIFQDEDSVSIAVIIYSLSKILERGKPDTTQIINLMQEGIQNLEKGDGESYKAIIKELFRFVSQVDTKIKLYIEEVVKQAEIKKGSKIYDHGVSLGQAASILGISQWELMSYVGKTRIADVDYERPDVIEKIKFTRGLFG